MRVLVVDDDRIVRFALKELFEGEKDKVFTVESAEAALKVIKNEQIDFALVDYQLPGINGLDLLTVIKKEHSSIEVIMITGFGSADIAVESIKRGAFDYVAKPFDNAELLNRVKHLRKILEVYDESDLSIFSPKMEEMISKLKTVAVSDVPVFITGETGTGKDVFARKLHRYSKREGEYIAINCSALPESIIESELFGAEKGAFTGADSMKKGFFELADNGTLFLDEIGEMPYRLQAKLLRVIQEGEVFRLGGSKAIKINTRIVAATNINIEDEMKNKTFREDLYYRLNVIRFKLPPLRERKEEIKPLVYLFLKEFNNKYDKSVKDFSESALEKLFGHDYQGNIRELKNIIERTVLLSVSDIIDADKIEFLENSDIEFAGEVSQNDYEKLPINLTLAKKVVTDKFEADFITHYLEQNNFNVQKTSTQIGQHRQDLYKKIKKYNINIGTQ